MLSVSFVSKETFLGLLIFRTMTDSILNQVEGSSLGFQNNLAFRHISFCGENKERVFHSLINFCLFVIIIRRLPANSLKLTDISCKCSILRTSVDILDFSYLFEVEILFLTINPKNEKLPNLNK